jgi:hypothetical protein
LFTHLLVSWQSALHSFDSACKKQTTLINGDSRGRMAGKAEIDWLSVIGRSLSYLCLEHARKESPKKFDTVQKKVDFLIDMGLPKDAAAYVVGSTPESVAKLASYHAKKGTKRGKKSRK